MKTIRLVPRAPISESPQPGAGPPAESLPPADDADSGGAPERHKDPPPANTHPLFRKVPAWHR